MCNYDTLLLSVAVFLLYDGNNFPRYYFSCGASLVLVAVGVLNCHVHKIIQEFVLIFVLCVVKPNYCHVITLLRVCRPAASSQRHL